MLIEHNTVEEFAELTEALARDLQGQGDRAHSNTPKGEFQR